MNVHDYRFLLSEQKTLTQLINQTSPGNVIGRMSLESRAETKSNRYWSRIRVFLHISLTPV